MSNCNPCVIFTYISGGSYISSPYLNSLYFRLFPEISWSAVLRCISLPGPPSLHTFQWVLGLRPEHAILKRPLDVYFFFYLLYCRMFTDSCRRLRIMKGSDAVGLGKYRSHVVQYWSIACVHAFLSGSIEENLLYVALHKCIITPYICFTHKNQKCQFAWTRFGPSP